MNEQGTVGKPRQLLRKPQRRAQLIAAAARAFVRAGFAATSLEDVAAEAGVTRVVIYHHFDSKRALYLAVLQDARERVQSRVETTGRSGDEDEPAEESDGQDRLYEVALAARDNPDGFRLLYRHARREPEFADHVADLLAGDELNAERSLRTRIADSGQRAWLASLVGNVVLDAALTWLDAGRPVSVDRLAATMRELTQALLAVPE